jgi:peptidoglycan/xylan/chitin deacetylase (PgdA/CDA1 family)
MTPGYGALVVSLDFELHWGVRHTTPPDGPYRRNLLGVWEAVPKMLALFEEYDIAATWATVGFLFAKSRQEIEEFSPSVKPSYENHALYPYDEPIGEDEADDPLHFAPSLIEAIRRSPRQELATHTFSHYFCLEPGQTREAFKADLDSALSIARENEVQIQSIVFPRNQHNLDYDDLLINAGIVCYRTRQLAQTNSTTEVAEGTKLKPGLRPAAKLLARETRLKRRLRPVAGVLDYYVDLSGSHTVSWDSIRQDNGLCNIRGSFPIAPYSPRWKRFEALRIRRIVECIKRAAVSKEIFHIWWHPHNFGINIDQNIDFLRGVLQAFSRYRDSHGMRSMSMTDVAAAVRESYE